MQITHCERLRGNTRESRHSQSSLLTEAIEKLPTSLKEVAMLYHEAQHERCVSFTTSVLQSSQGGNPGHSELHSLSRCRFCESYDYFITTM